MEADHYVALRRTEIIHYVSTAKVALGILLVAMLWFESNSFPFFFLFLADFSQTPLFWQRWTARHTAKWDLSGVAEMHEAAFQEHSGASSFRSCVSPGQGHTSNKCKWMEVLFKPSMQPISLCGSCQNHVNWPFSLLAFPYWVSAHQKLCRSWSLCCQKSPGTFWHEGMLAPGSGSVVCSPMLFPNLSICCIEHELLSPWTQHESNRWHLLNVFTRTSSNSHFYVF